MTNNIDVILMRSMYKIDEGKPGGIQKSFSRNIPGFTKVNVFSEKRSKNYRNFTFVFGSVLICLYFLSKSKFGIM